MKTLVLATVSAAALFTAGSAFATVTDPNMPKASDLPMLSAQAPTGYNSAAEITQIGSNQTGAIDARGSANGFAQIVQGSNSNDQRNNASITQNGGGDREHTLVAQYGQGNRSTTTQSGNYEKGVTSQIGYNNVATVTQNGNGDDGKYASDQGVDNISSGETATDLRQNWQRASDKTVFGWGNAGLSAVRGAYVLQIGYGNTGTVDQGGNNSTATIFQRGSLSNDGSGYNTASISQSGSRDKALVVQSGSYNGYMADTLSQIGNDDKALVFETGYNNNYYVTQGQSNTYAAVLQTGSGNYAQIQH